MTRAIYLDHAATAFPKAPGVSDAVAQFLDSAAGNPGRGGHRMAVAASRVVEDTRVAVAALLGGEPERTLFGPSATYWLNTLLLSELEAGSRVVVSALEHNAVMRPLGALERARGIEVAVVEGRAPDGVPTPEECAAEVRRAPTAAVVLCHASNVHGAVAPVRAIADAVAPVPVFVDGAQSAGSLPLDFASLGCAAFVCSAHKGLLGPPGVGVMLLAPGFVPAPLVRGGTGSHSESTAMPDELPDRLEAGTANAAGIAGLGAACRFLAERGVEELHARSAALRARLVEGLAAIDRVRLVGEGPDSRTATLSFTMEGQDAGELAAWLDRERGLLVRVGLHCAPAAHRRLGTFPTGTVRVGLGPFNRSEDVERLIEALGGR